MFKIKTNQQLQTLIQMLKDQSRREGVAFWYRIASDLEAPTSKRSIVNLSKLDYYTKDNEIIVVPGKVLAGGTLGHKLTVAALQCSGSARTKIEAAQGKVLNLHDIMKQHPKAQKLRIIA